MYKYADLYYICWLIEGAGRAFAMPRRDVINLMGKERVRNYMRFADVFHCENPDKIIGELAEELCITFANEPFNKKKPGQPSQRQMAGVYARIIQRTYADDYEKGVYEFFNSFLPPILLDYKNELYWSSMHHLSESYKEGKIL